MIFRSTTAILKHFPRLVKGVETLYATQILWLAWRSGCHGLMQCPHAPLPHCINSTNKGLRTRAYEVGYTSPHSVIAKGVGTVSSHQQKRKVKRCISFFPCDSYPPTYRCLLEWIARLLALDISISTFKLLESSGWISGYFPHLGGETGTRKSGEESVVRLSGPNLDGKCLKTVGFARQPPLCQKEVISRRSRLSSMSIYRTWDSERSRTYE